MMYYLVMKLKVCLLTSKSNKLRVTFLNFGQVELVIFLTLEKLSVIVTANFG